MNCMIQFVWNCWRDQCVFASESRAAIYGTEWIFLNEFLFDVICLPCGRNTNQVTRRFWCVSSFRCGDIKRMFCVEKSLNCHTRKWTTENKTEIKTKKKLFLSVKRIFSFSSWSRFILHHSSWFLSWVNNWKVVQRIGRRKKTVHNNNGIICSLKKT